MPGWEWCTNDTNEVRGRIWVVWNPNMVKFTRVESSVQYVHGLVDMQQSGFKFLFTAVYGLHTIATRSSLWEKVKQLSTHIREQGLIMGDFNSILAQEDRPIGSQVQLAETKYFRECMIHSNITELHTIGRQYTWNNGHVFSRIDRALVNDGWVNRMPPLQVIVIEALFSDHSPLSIKVETQRDIRKKPFRFYNCLAQHPDFKPTIQTSWQRQNGGMQGVWNNLKIVRREMQHLNKKKYVGVTGKVQQLRTELVAKQNQMQNIHIPQHMIEEEKEIRAQLTKWSLIKESI
ncbi:hypothetical protein KY284_032799 [Solanum tuberosum]|nr:hypothetical protein KY284_032799 [Solanum tuberosum]